MVTGFRRAAILQSVCILNSVRISAHSTNVLDREPQTYINCHVLVVVKGRRYDIDDLQVDIYYGPVLVDERQ